MRWPWGYKGMTAASPEGPYSAAKLLLYPERKGFHPPLMEFHPAFMHEGYIYAPATSVALNRNFQMMWRVRIEEAMNPDAWEIYRYGSLWHAEPVEHEHYGIWGQTFSGFVDDAGMFRVMFPSRDSQGMGTINTASRPWDAPYRDRGFYVSAHGGPSFVRLKRGGEVNKIAAALDVRGTVTLVWNSNGPVGPNRPTADASPHPLMLRDYTGLRLDSKSWTLVTVTAEGESQTIAQGEINTAGRIECAITWDENKVAKLKLHNEEVWSGQMPKNQGAMGVLAESFSSANIEKFALTGVAVPARTVFLHGEAILGAAQTMTDWDKVQDDRFRYGIGVVSHSPNVQGKWNIVGTSAMLWAPRGPHYGSADVYLDGVFHSRLNFRADTIEKSQPLLTLTDLGNTYHSISLQNLEGAIPLDVLEVVH